MDATIIPFAAVGALAGFIGGLTNLVLWRQTLRNKKAFSAALHKTLKESFNADIKKSGSGNLLQIQENIITLFDDFMENKLTQKMPVLSMFIDEKLISEIRVIFHAEMEESLPKLLEQKLLSVDFTSESAFQVERMLNYLIKKYRNRLILFQFLSMAAGGLTGFFIGIIF